MLREFVNSQHFTSTSEIMESMKELFSDVLQQVMEAELEEKKANVYRKMTKTVVEKITGTDT